MFDNFFCQNSAITFYNGCMSIPGYLRLYILSPAGAAILAGSLAVGAVVAWLWFPAAGITAVPFAWLCGSYLLFRRGIGAQAVIQERDRQRSRIDSAAMESAANRTRRMASLRLSDPDVRKMASLAGIKAGEYYSRCKKHGGYSPEAGHAIEECLQILDAWLAEQDSRSTVRRFAADSPGTTSDTSLEELKQRSLSLLQDRIAIIERASRELAGGLTTGDRLSVMEDMKELDL